MSQVAPHNYINLLFRTNCESDVVSYHVHRSVQPNFLPDDSNRIGVASADTVVKGGKGYGQTPVDRPMRDYDHMMYQDDAVEPTTTYYYRVCAVDAAGHQGPYSEEAVGKTGPKLTAAEAEAQSVLHSELGPDKAIDGDRGPASGWASAPYGGGSKDQPRQVWLTVVFPKKIALRGVRIVGEQRPGVSPPKAYRIQARDGDAWKPFFSLLSPKGPSVLLRRMTGPLKTEALRLVFLPADLPHSDDPQEDGVVRIREMLLLLPDGKEVTIPSLFRP